MIKALLTILFGGPGKPWQEAWMDCLVLASAATPWIVVDLVGRHPLIIY
jgi:hypothetical protein